MEDEKICSIDITIKARELLKNAKTKVSKKSKLKGVRLETYDEVLKRIFNSDTSD